MQIVYGSSYSDSITNNPSNAIDGNLNTYTEASDAGDIDIKYNYPDVSLSGASSVRVAISIYTKDFSNDTLHIYARVGGNDFDLFNDTPSDTSGSHDVYYIDIDASNFPNGTTSDLEFHIYDSQGSKNADKYTIRIYEAWLEFTPKKVARPSSVGYESGTMTDPANSADGKLDTYATVQDDSGTTTWDFPSVEIDYRYSNVYVFIEAEQSTSSQSAELVIVFDGSEHSIGTVGTGSGEDVKIVTGDISPLKVRDLSDAHLELRLSCDGCSTQQTVRIRDVVVCYQDPPPDTIVDVETATLSISVGTPEIVIPSATIYAERFTLDVVLYGIATPKTTVVDPFGDGTGKNLFTYDNDLDDASGSATTSSAASGISISDGGRFDGFAENPGGDSYDSIQYSGTALNSSEWTISLWFKFDPKDSTSVYFPLLSFGSNDDTYLSFRHKDDDAGDFNQSSDTDEDFDLGYEIGEWQHLTVVVNGSDAKYYLNSVLKKELGGFHPADDNVEAYVSDFVSIDQLRIFDKAIPSCRISNLYTEYYDEVESCFDVVGRVFNLSIDLKEVKMPACEAHPERVLLSIAANSERYVELGVPYAFNGSDTLDIFGDGSCKHLWSFNGQTVEDKGSSSLATTGDGTFEPGKWGYGYHSTDEWKFTFDDIPDDDWTIVCYAKLRKDFANAGNSGGWVFWCGSDSYSDHNGYGMNPSKDGIQCYVYGVNGGTFGTGVLRNGAWAQIGFKRDKANERLWIVVNGSTYAYYDTSDDTVNPPPSLRLKPLYGSGDEVVVDQIRIFDRQLSYSEFRELRQLDRKNNPKFVGPAFAKILPTGGRVPKPALIEPESANLGLSVYTPSLYIGTKSEVDIERFTLAEVKVNPDSYPLFGTHLKIVHTVEPLHNDTFGIVHTVEKYHSDIFDIVHSIDISVIVRDRFDIRYNYATLTLSTFELAYRMLDFVIFVFNVVHGLWVGYDEIDVVDSFIVYQKKDGTGPRDTLSIFLARQELETEYLPVGKRFGFGIIQRLRDWSLRDDFLIYQLSDYDYHIANAEYVFDIRSFVYQDGYLRIVSGEYFNPLDVGVEPVLAADWSPIRCVIDGTRNCSPNHTEFAAVGQEIKLQSVDGAFGRYTIDVPQEKSSFAGGDLTVAMIIDLPYNNLGGDYSEAYFNMTVLFGDHSINIHPGIGVTITDETGSSKYHKSRIADDDGNFITRNTDGVCPVEGYTSLYKFIRKELVFVFDRSRQWANATFFGATVYDGPFITSNDFSRLYIDPQYRSTNYEYVKGGCYSVIALPKIVEYDKFIEWVDCGVPTTRLSHFIVRQSIIADRYGFASSIVSVFGIAQACEESVRKAMVERTEIGRISDGLVSYYPLNGTYEDSFANYDFSVNRNPRFLSGSYWRTVSPTYLTYGDSGYPESKNQIIFSADIDLGMLDEWSVCLMRSNIASYSIYSDYINQQLFDISGVDGFGLSVGVLKSSVRYVDDCGVHQSKDIGKTFSIKGERRTGLWIIEYKDGWLREYFGMEKVLWSESYIGTKLKGKTFGVHCDGLRGIYYSGDSSAYISSVLLYSKAVVSAGMFDDILAFFKRDNFSHSFLIYERIEPDHYHSVYFRFVFDIVSEVETDWKRVNVSFIGASDYFGDGSCRNHWKLDGHDDVTDYAGGLDMVPRISDKAKTVRWALGNGVKYASYSTKASIVDPHHLDCDEFTVSFKFYSDNIENGFGLFTQGDTVLSLARDMELGGYEDSETIYLDSGKMQLYSPKSFISMPSNSYCLTGIREEPFQVKDYKSEIERRVLHFVFRVIRHQQMQLYVDGRYVASIPHFPYGFNGSGTILGGKHTYPNFTFSGGSERIPYRSNRETGSYYVNGIVSNIRIFDRLLSEHEIKALRFEQAALHIFQNVERLKTTRFVISQAVEPLYLMVRICDDPNPFANANRRYYLPLSHASVKHYSFPDMKNSTWCWEPSGDDGQHDIKRRPSHGWVVDSDYLLHRDFYEIDDFHRGINTGVVFTEDDEIFTISFAFFRTINVTVWNGCEIISAQHFYPPFIVTDASGYSACTDTVYVHTKLSDDDDEIWLYDDGTGDYAHWKLDEPLYPPYANRLDAQCGKTKWNFIAFKQAPMLDEHGQKKYRCTVYANGREYVTVTKKGLFPRLSHKVRRDFKWATPHGFVVGGWGAVHNFRVEWREIPKNELDMLVPEARLSRFDVTTGIEKIHVANIRCIVMQRIEPSIKKIDKVDDIDPFGDGSGIWLQKFDERTEIVNSIEFKTDGYVEYVDGVYDKAINIGMNGYELVQHSDTICYGDDFTLSVWVYARMNNTTGLFNVYSILSGKTHVYVEYDSAAGKIKFNGSDTYADPDEFADKFSLYTLTMDYCGEPVDPGVTKNGPYRVKLYVNAVLVYDTTVGFESEDFFASENSIKLSPIGIGGKRSEKFDQYRIFCRTLSMSEISALLDERNFAYRFDIVGKMQEFTVYRLDIVSGVEPLHYRNMFVVQSVKMVPKFTRFYITSSVKIDGETIFAVRSIT